MRVTAEKLSFLRASCFAEQKALALVSADQSIRNQTLETLFQVCRSFSSDFTKMINLGHIRSKKGLASDFQS
jgi:hypothetical protein